MVYRLINFFLFIQFLLGSTEGDYIHGPRDVHTSTYLLQNLANKELALAQKLTDFVEMIDTHSKQLRKYRKKFHSVVNKEKDISKFVSNPLNALGAVKRLSSGISNHFKPLMVDKKIEKGRQKVFDVASTYPSLNDYNETCLNIVLLQRMYKLDITELIKGKIIPLGSENTKLIPGVFSRLQCTQIRYMNQLISDQGLNKLGKEAKEDLENV